MVQELHHLHLRAQAAPHRTQLQTDHAASHHDQALRDLAQLQRTRAVDDALLRVVHRKRVDRTAVCTSPTSHTPTRTRSQNDVRGLNRALTSRQQLRTDRVLVLQTRSTLDVLHSVLLEQELDSVRQTTNLGSISTYTPTAFSLVFMIVFRSKLTLSAFTPYFFMVFFASSYLRITHETHDTHQRRMQKSLRGDASNVQARASQLSALLDTRRLQTHLSRLNGSHISTRTSTDDHHVEPTGITQKERLLVSRSRTE